MSLDAAYVGGFLASVMMCFAWTMDRSVKKLNVLWQSWGLQSLAAGIGHLSQQYHVDFYFGKVVSVVYLGKLLFVIVSVLYLLHYICVYNVPFQTKQNC